jgi:hypothetical protein
MVLLKLVIGLIAAFILLILIGCLEKNIVFGFRVLVHLPKYKFKAWEVVRLKYGFNSLAKETAAKELLKPKKVSPRILALVENFLQNSNNSEIYLLYWNRMQIRFNLGVTEIILVERQIEKEKLKSATRALAA